MADPNSLMIKRSYPKARRLEMLHTMFEVQSIHLQAALWMVMSLSHIKKIPSFWEWPPTSLRNNWRPRCVIPPLLCVGKVFFFYPSRTCGSSFFLLLCVGKFFFFYFTFEWVKFFFFFFYKNFLLPLEILWCVPKELPSNSWRQLKTIAIMTSQTQNFLIFWLLISGIFYSCQFIKSFRPFHSFWEEDKLSRRSMQAFQNDTIIISWLFSFRVMQWHTFKTFMFVFINCCSSQKRSVKYLINIDLIWLSVTRYNPKLSHGLTCHFRLDRLHWCAKQRNRTSMLLSELWYTYKSI